MVNRLAQVLALIFWLASTTFVPAQGPANDLHVKLSLAEDKTTYRIGEPIKIALEFTADRDGYEVDEITDTSESPTETLFISPDSGVRHWRKECLGLGYRDVSSRKKLSLSPIRLEFTLNDSIRFDQPGRYAIKIEVRRVSTTPGRTDRYQYSPPIPLVTNEISFDVQSMSEAAEKEEVARLSKLIESTRDVRARAQICANLSYLTGNPSSEEKVRLFLNPEMQCDSYSGLFIARNRVLVIKLLESALRNPNIPASSSLLGALTQLRLLQEGRTAPLEPRTMMDYPKIDQRLAEIQDAYVAELAAGLGKRAGKSQTTTAMTILTHLPNDPQVAGAALREVRRLLLTQFDNLDSFEQETLLNRYWEQMREPSLVPSFKRLLDSSDRFARFIRGTVLKRLIEIAPDEARPYVIAEIKDPKSFVDLEILGSLSDQTLPDVDSALLKLIRQFASSKQVADQMYLKQKASLAVRYATNAIYPDLMQIYRDTASTLTVESKACMLAYLAKHNDQETLPLIEQVLTEVPRGQEFNFLPELTRLYFSDSLDALLRKRLESDEQETASMAAYLISLHGSASDQKAIEARLDRWRQEWAERRGEADTNLQGRIESELISAMTRAKSWTLSPERVKQLKQSCITQICRQNFPVQ